MSERADLDELARRYLDLWQDQIAALAGDKDFARAVHQLMTTMGLAGPAASAAWAAWPAMMAGLAPAARAEAAANGKTRDEARGFEPAGAPRAAAAAAASGGGEPRLDQLARRLAVLEERIAALEARGARRGRGAAGGARKRRS